MAIPWLIGRTGLTAGLVVLGAACGSGAADSGGTDAAVGPGQGARAADASDGSRHEAGATGADGGSGPGLDATAGSGDSSATDDASLTDSESGAVDGAPGDAAASCAMSFPAAADFGKKGAFDVAIDCSAPTSVTADGTGCAIYHPTSMGQGGLKHPVIVWGNGTAAPSACTGDAHVFGEYDYLFNQWASHGFIVAVANTSSTGSGTDMLSCLDWVEQQNTVAGSIYQGVVDVGNYGASGHSQGGGSTLNVGEDPRVRTTIPFMPYTVGGGFQYDPAAPTKQTGPMFLASGGQDNIATPSTNQQPVFDASVVPTFWGTLVAADHVSFAGGTQTDWLAPSTAWFRLFLMCDQSARPVFYGPSCTLCTDSKWSVQRKNM